MLDNINNAVTSTIINECCMNTENWILLERKGDLQTYKCKKCGILNEAHVSYPIEGLKLPELCKIYVKWKKDINLSIQVKELKRIIPYIRNINSVDIYNYAKLDNTWIIDKVMYLQEAQDIISTGEKAGLMLGIVEVKD